MFQQEISQLNLQQLKAGEKRWIGSLLGSSAALLFKELRPKVQIYTSLWQGIISI